METETSNTQLFTLTNSMGAKIVVMRGDLERIVQEAYDQHGIIASPSYATEAERATDEAKPGGCLCGLEGCSDRPTYVDEYRSGLQVGAL